MSSNGEHSSMTEQRHKQRTPPEWAAASSWSDHADAEEEEQNDSFLEMPHHQQSNDYYDEINEEDIIISDENGEYSYGMQEMKDFTHHDDGLADENNDEVASMHTNGHYEGNDYYNENEQVQFFDDDGYPLDNHDESGYQSHDNDGGGSIHDDYY